MTKNYYLLNEIRQAFFCPKVYIVLIFQFIITHYLTVGIRALAIASGCNCTPWLLPFEYSYAYLQFFYGITTTYIYSSVPFMEKQQLYILIRNGRKKWLFSQYIRILGTSVLLAFAHGITCIIVLLPYLKLDVTWGSILKTLALTDATGVYGIRFPFSYMLINQFTPIEAFISVMIRMIVLSSTIGIVMFTVALTRSKILAIIFGTFCSIMAIVTYNLAFFYGWIKYLSPYSWLDLIVENKNRIASLREWHHYSSRLAIIVMICWLICRCFIEKIDFTFTNEVGK